MTDSEAIQPNVVDPQEDGEEVIHTDCFCPHCGQHVVASHILGKTADGTQYIGVSLLLERGQERRVH